VLEPSLALSSAHTSARTTSSLPLSTSCTHAHGRTLVRMNAHAHTCMHVRAFRRSCLPSNVAAPSQLRAPHIAQLDARACARACAPCECHRPSGHRTDHSPLSVKSTSKNHWKTQMTPGVHPRARQPCPHSSTAAAAAPFRSSACVGCSMCWAEMEKMEEGRPKEAMQRQRERQSRPHVPFLWTHSYAAGAFGEQALGGHMVCASSVSPPLRVKTSSPLCHTHGPHLPLRQNHRAAQRAALCYALPHVG